MMTIINGQSRRLLVIGAVLLAGLAIFAQTARGQVPENQIPQDLRAAIKAEVELRGEKYAGLCREIDQDQHVLQWCAFVQSLTADRAEVTFGAVLSDELHQAIFIKSGGAWIASGRGPVPNNQIPQDLRAAIKAEVESRDKTYAGLCLEIDQNQHVFQWCAFVQSLTQTQAEVTFGPVLSDEIERVTFTRAGAGWVAATATSTPPPTPTATPAPDPSIPAELRAAIKRAVEARGKTFAGLCNEIDQNQHVGEWCAAVQSLSAGQAKVVVGAVLSDELHPITFVKSGNAWVTTLTIAPPNTGGAGLATD